MELWEYKLKTTQIGNTDDDESDSNPELINDKVRTKVVKNKKPLKLEKVGKRIKRIISEDSSEDSSFDFGTKGQLPVKDQLPVKGQLPVKPPNANPPCPPSTSPPPSTSREKAIATTSSGPSSPAISKLPRM